MTTESKHREFFVLHEFMSKLTDPPFNEYRAYDDKASMPKVVGRTIGHWHVVEYGAHEELRAELKEQCEINSIGQERELKLINEIALLKARLLGFEGRTFSENQEIVQLKAEIKALEAKAKNEI